MSVEKDNRKPGGLAIEFGFGEDPVEQLAKRYAWGASVGRPDTAARLAQLRAEMKRIEGELARRCGEYLGSLPPDAFERDRDRTFRRVDRFAIGFVLVRLAGRLLNAAAGEDTAANVVHLWPRSEACLALRASSSCEPPGSLRLRPCGVVRNTICCIPLAG
ncbi:MAG: hypothetical protein GYA57_06820 [Myxococcales bacterium]|nr:hypothetical protein [Myxococcales bacterium]